MREENRVSHYVAALNFCPLKAERKVQITSGFELKEAVFAKNGFWKLRFFVSVH